jgi:hypothetical protein
MLTNFHFEELLILTRLQRGFLTKTVFQFCASFLEEGLFIQQIQACGITQEISKQWKHASEYTKAALKRFPADVMDQNPKLTELIK